MNLKQNEGLECENDSKNTTRALLGIFLSNIKRNMNKYVHELVGLKTNNVYFTDTD